jgi:hypothetical protein
MLFSIHLRYTPSLYATRFEMLVNRLKSANQRAPVEPNCSRLLVEEMNSHQIGTRK